MSLTKTKAFGPIVLLITQYFTKIMGPLISILLVRYLGVENYGLYSAAIAVTSFLTFLPDFGLQQSALKISAEKDIKLNILIKSTLYTSMIYTGITLLFLIAWLNIFQYEITVKFIAYILSISFFQISILKIIQTLLQIKREFTRIAFWSVSINTSQWIATLIGILINLELYSLIFWPQIVSLIITIIMLLIEGKRINLFTNMNPLRERASYKEIVKNSLEFGTANSMYQMYHRSDAMILSATRSPVEVGFYNVAFRVAELVYTFAGVLFNQVLYPAFFKWSKQDRTKYFRYYRLLNKVMILFGAFSATMVCLFSNEIIFIIFGSEQASSILLLKIMMLAVPLRFLVVSVGAILTTDNLVRERIKIQAKIAVLNVGSNALFVPVYGAIAAAILMVITDGMLMLGYIIAVNKRITNNHFSKKILFQIPVLLVLMFTGFYFSNTILLYKLVISGVIIAVILVVAFLIMEKDEFEEIKAQFRR